MKKVKIHPDFTLIIPDNKMFEMRGCVVTKKNGHTTIEMLNPDFSRLGVFNSPDVSITDNTFLAE